MNTVDNPPAFNRLEPLNLRHRARSAIRAKIVDGEVKAGEIYPVAYFASQLGVSASPVREALFDLAHEGLVELVRNRGFRIIALSEHDLEEIFELRLLLEVPSVGRLVGRMTELDLAECGELARLTEEIAATGDLVRYLEADRDFHLRLLRPLNNGRLLESVRRLRDQMRLYGLLSLSETGVVTPSPRDHRAILDAIRRGDAVEAETLTKRHIEHTRRIWSNHGVSPSG